MYHFVSCPKCQCLIKFPCGDVPNPFQRIHADHIAQILNPTAEKTMVSPLSRRTETQLKLLFLLNMIGDDLPLLEQLPELPSDVAHFVDHANAEQIKHLLIQTIGRWDVVN